MFVAGFFCEMIAAMFGQIQDQVQVQNRIAKPEIVVNFDANAISIRDSGEQT